MNESSGDLAAPRWHQVALPRIERILDNAEFDPVGSTVTLELDPEDEGVGGAVTFASLEGLREALLAYGEDLVHGRRTAGRAVFSVDHESLLEEVLEESGVRDFFTAAEAPAEGDLLLSARDTASASAGIAIDFSRVNDALVAALARQPDLMYELNPRRFEELVAELFDGMGYHVVLTPQTRDGGRDLQAYRKEPYGTLLTLVECKRYAKDRAVGVGVVRALYGVVETERASHGIIATTSFFSRGARAEHVQLGFRLSLAGYEQIAAWCHQHRRPR